MITDPLRCGLVNGRTLSLRPPDPDLAPVVHPWITDPALARSFMMDWKPTLEQYREMLRGAPQATNRFAWMVFWEDEVVGVTAVRGLENPAVGIGEPLIIVGPEYQGKGIATCALRCQADFLFGLTRPRFTCLHVTVRKDNLASLRVMEKLGYLEWQGSPDLYHRSLDGSECQVWQGYLPNPRLRVSVG